jgi:hypothetical protein
MPSDAQQTWTNWHLDVRESDNPVRREFGYMLQRFALRPAMKEAWAELARLKKITPSELVTMTVSTYFSAMRLMMGIKRVKRIEPSSTSPAQNLARNPWHEFATQADSIANALRRVHPSILVGSEITDVTFKELDRITRFFKKEAAIADATINWVPLPRKIGARNAQQITFVNHMCTLLWQPTGRRPYKLVAILANVTFGVSENKEWDANRVKKCYASRSRSK